LCRYLPSASEKASTVPSKPHSSQQSRLLRRSEVEAKVGHGRSWIYAAMQTGEFPRAVSIGPRSVAWYEDEIDAWIASRPRRRA
jgi:prophage regulatory protein